MFRDIIRETKFTSQDANIFFNEKIDGSVYLQDVSFLTAMRVLLGKRVKAGEKAFMEINNFKVSNSKHTKIIDVFNIEYTQNDHLYIVCLDCSDTETIRNNNVYEICSSKFLEETSGYEEVPKFEAFCRALMDAKAFVNKEERKTIVFVNDMKRYKFRFLSITISRLFPWFFEREPLTDWEKDFLKSFQEKDATRFLSFVEEASALYDFETMRVKRLLTGFENASNEKLLMAEKSKLRQEDDIIKGIKQRFEIALNDRKNIIIRIAGLEEIISENEGKSEILDYFLSNKELTLIDVDDETIYFVTQTRMEYWDEDYAETIIDNDKSYLYKTDVPKDDVRLLMQHIFIDRDVKMRMCAAYKFSTGHVRGLSGYSFKDHNVGLTYFPNPHINRFECLGSYDSAIVEYLERGDYIGALAQAVASCRSLNLQDSPVMNEFVDRLIGEKISWNRVCLEMPNGDILDPFECIERLKKEEDNE